MISKTGAVKVMDFGIARAIADTGNPVTQTAAVIGTAQYLSPEQAAAGRRPLGCVLAGLCPLRNPDRPTTGSSATLRCRWPISTSAKPRSAVAQTSGDLSGTRRGGARRWPEPRQPYQSAAEMRAGLVRAHSGEKPGAQGVDPGL